MAYKADMERETETKDKAQERNWEHPPGLL